MLKWQTKSPAKAADDDIFTWVKLRDIFHELLTKAIQY